jgi:hypothetical protein
METHFPFLKGVIYCLSSQRTRLKMYAGSRSRDGRTPGRLRPDYVAYVKDQGEGRREVKIIASLEAKHRLAAKHISVVGSRGQRCDGECQFSRIELGHQTKEGLMQLCQVSEDGLMRCAL